MRKQLLEEATQAKGEVRRAPRERRPRRGRDDGEYSAPAAQVSLWDYLQPKVASEPVAASEPKPAGVITAEDYEDYYDDAASFPEPAHPMPSAQKSRSQATTEYSGRHQGNTRDTEYTRQNTRARPPRADSSRGSDWKPKPGAQPESAKVGAEPGNHSAVVRKEHTEWKPSAKGPAPDPRPPLTQSAKPKSAWKVGDQCLALFTGDGGFYEATVTAVISANLVKVKFAGYDDEPDTAVQAQNVKPITSA